MADTKLSDLTLKTGNMVASDLVEITEGGNTTKSVTGTKIIDMVTSATVVTANTAKTGITSGQAAAIVANTDKTTYPSSASTKLAGIEASATADQTDAEIRAAVEAATDSNVFVDADHTKLNAIEASATADQTNDEIKAAVEAASDSNTFTDADHTKLNAIEASADVTDSTNVVAALTAGTGITIAADGTVAAGPLAVTTVQIASSQSAQLALTAQEGDVVVRSDENKSYMHNSGSAGTMDDYTLLATPTDVVLSVNGVTGAVTAANIATAVEAASGSNTFTDADHSKLNAIAASANNYVHPNHSGEITSTADGATVVADNVVDEANLKVSNSPTNAYVLTAQSGASGGLTWAEAAAGGYTPSASAPSSPDDGDHWFDTGTGILYVRVASNWIDVSTAAAGDVYVHPNHSGEVTSTADGATVIAGNVVDEANLKVSNGPTNGYVLTAQSGNTGGMTWAAETTQTTVSGNAGTVTNGVYTTGTQTIAGAKTFSDDAIFSGTLGSGALTATTIAGTTGTFSGDVEVNGGDIVMDSAGFNKLTMDRGTSGQYNQLSFQTAGAQDWELTHNSNNDFYLYNNATSTFTLMFDGPTDSATFAGDVMTGVTSSPTAGEAGTYLNAGGYTYSSRAGTTKAPHFLISNNNGACGNIASNGTGEFLISSGTGQVTALTLDNSQNATFAGDVTAGKTFNPQSSTAAGDNASVGYASGEGLILTGQGSNTDVVMKNDAGQSVLNIPTGTRNVVITAGDFNVAGQIQYVGGASGLYGTSSGTADNTIRLDTTGATAYVGVNGSSGNRWVGSTAYWPTFGTASGVGLEFATSNNVRFKIDSAGAATFAGQLNVNKGSSSNKITMGATSYAGGTALQFLSSGVKNWQISSNHEVSNAFVIGYSSSDGGTTFSNDALTLSNTGNATFAGYVTQTKAGYLQYDKYNTDTGVAGSTRTMAIEQVQGKSNTGVKRVFQSITYNSADATNAGEDGNTIYRQQVAGTLSTWLTVDGINATFGGNVTTTYPKMFNAGATTGALGVQGTRKYQFDGSQFYPVADNTLSLGATGHRFVNTYLSGSLFIGGTGSANGLDDYEEGTFSGVLADASSGGNAATFGTSQFYYTKVGDLCTVMIALVNINTTGMTGGNSLYFTGLPFTSKNATNFIQAGSLATSNVTLTSGAATAVMSPNLTYLGLSNQKTGGGADPILVSDLTSTSADFYLNFTYKTT